jgi:hypothetical protein
MTARRDGCFEVPIELLKVGAELSERHFPGPEGVQRRLAHEAAIAVLRAAGKAKVLLGMTEGKHNGNVYLEESGPLARAILNARRVHEKSGNQKGKKT